jgi:iron(III) transport system ATP-binding protein
MIHTQPDPPYAIVCRGVAKAFGPVRAIKGVDFELERGAFGALLGPSGCGKTTLLRLLAGFEVPSGGAIAVGGEEVATARWAMPPERRRIGMVFQEYALFPHLDVARNVAYGLDRGADKAARVAEVLELVGLSGLGGRMPHELSGGQQQRVALARALAPRPQLILLDEPFSNLDAGLREQVRAATRQILRQVAATALFVTHDQEEAFSLADRVAVMLDGTIVQSGTPHEVYLRPASRAVAEFVGQANFLPGEAAEGTVQCALGQLLLAAPASGPVQVMVRPEALYLTPDPRGAALITGETFYGHDQVLEVRLADGSRVAVRTGPRLDLRPDIAVDVRVQGPVVAYPAGSS